MDVGTILASSIHVAISVKQGLRGEVARSVKDLSCHVWPSTSQYDPTVHVTNQSTPAALSVPARSVREEPDAYSAGSPATQLLCIASLAPMFTSMWNRTASLETHRPRQLTIRVPSPASLSASVRERPQSQRRQEIQKPMNKPFGGVVFVFVPM